MFAFGMLFFVAGLLIVITTLTVLQPVKILHLYQRAVDSLRNCVACPSYAPRCVVDWLRWLTTFLGRAFTYLWIGCIFLWPHYHNHGLRYITAIFLIIVAVVYIILRFAFGMGDTKCLYVQSPGGFRRTQKTTRYRSSFSYQDNPHRGRRKKKKKKAKQHVTAYASSPPPAPGRRGGGSKGWKKTKDRSTGKTYYYNVYTNETSWSRPY